MEENNLDKATNLFEHLRNRLPDIDGYGDSGKTLDDNLIPNHSCFQQSIREGCEGDVGIFEVYTTEQPMLMGYACYIAEVQIAVVTIQGDIDGARDYLSKALDNIRSKQMSEHVYIKTCKLVNLKPLGKNGEGLQMYALNIKIKYLLSE